MKIVYTRHALKKFSDLRQIDVKVTRTIIRKTVKYPLDLAPDLSNTENMIASGNLNKDLIIRVVYRVESDIILIITFYPSRKGRYF